MRAHTTASALLAIPALRRLTITSASMSYIANHISKNKHGLRTLYFPNIFRIEVVIKEKKRDINSSL